MKDYTVTGTYTLPSLGKVYDRKVNPEVTLRSMTTLEEMKRLNKSDYPYKQMAEIIDDCLIEDPGISAYDMCFADYQFLLHKLRVVTYGEKYALQSTCPYCYSVNKGTIDLNQMVVKPFNQEEYDKYSEFVLPRTEHKIKIKMQTPRMLDNIQNQAKSLKKKSFNGDPAFFVSLIYLIDTVDGEKLDYVEKENFINTLPMMDTNYIVKVHDKLVESFGLDTALENTCDVCGLDYNSPFRITAEFFGPSVDF